MAKITANGIMKAMAIANAAVTLPMSSQGVCAESEAVDEFESTSDSVVTSLVRSNELY
jgi:hypothetical protein